MQQNPTKKANKAPVRTPKSPEDIKRELRERRALTPNKNAAEDYLAEGTKHFGL